MSRPRTTVLAALTLAGALLGGCGVGADVAGLVPAPAEVTTTAPVTSEAAQAIAARVLADAAAARAAKGDGAQATALRTKALAGAALAVATAESRLGATAPATTEPVTRPEVPKVLAISRGSQWPRLILAQSTGADGAVALNLLRSDAVDEPFRLAARAPMQPGAAVAALDDLAAGSPLVKGAEGLAGDPAALLAEYAASLAHPKPKPAPNFAAQDQFAMAVRANAAAQAKTLGSLASLAQVHRPLPDHTVVIALRDGGAVVFSLLERTDTIALRARGQALTPSPEFQRLTGKKTLKDRAVLKSYEAVVLTVPESGKAAVVAADETLVSAKGE